MKPDLFTEAEVRQLVALIGFYLPTNVLERCDDYINETIKLEEPYSPLVPLLKIARGAWRNNALGYGIGRLDDPNCDTGIEGDPYEGIEEE